MTTTDGFSSRPYVVVSTDGHAGPFLKRDLRPYCPAEHLDDFDAFARECDRILAAGVADTTLSVGTTSPWGGPEVFHRAKTCPGLTDPDARRRDMDTEGIAADVIFAGGGNDQPIPFVGFGAGAGPTGIEGELRAVGGQIWNDWLADFISDVPERHVGVMQVPIWDVDAAVATLRRGRAAGLTAANFPASRPDFPAYNEPLYDPFWSTCEDLGVTLMTHTGGGLPGVGAGGPGGMGVGLYEGTVHSVASVAQLIFGGVFERHPRLKVFYTEIRGGWLPDMLRQMDSLYFSDSTPATHCPLITKPPSDYWHAHCYIGGSSLSPVELAIRYDIGIGNLTWGADYPHTEGTWPRTRLSLRHAFADIPEDETRRILGENAIDALGLDHAALRAIADRIGPLPSELATPLRDDEIPEHPTCAFRRIGAFA